MKQYVDEKLPHLGGYTIGGDPATWYPDLWDWLVVSEHVRSVIDVGCGEGWALEYFKKLGCAVVGIDGVEQDHPSVVQWDYTRGFPPPFAADNIRGSVITQFHLCWCCEFVEHVEEGYIPHFLQTFKQANLVLMTHATPGQLGHHHVNLQDTSYWIGVMAAIGYQLDGKLLEQAWHYAGKNTSPYNHFLRSGLAFRRGVKT